MPLGIKPEKYAKLTPTEKQGVRWALVSTLEEAMRWVGVGRAGDTGRR